MGGESKWRKIKLALGLNSCLYLPKTTSDDESTNSPSSRSRRSDVRLRKPSTPSPSSSGVLGSNYGVKSLSKRICAICLTTMKTTNGQAIFTAECSHSFHFHCITSSVKHGNRVCPICRAKWKEIPLEKSGSSRVKSNTNSSSWAHHDASMILQGMPMPMPPRQNHSSRNVPLLFQALEPHVFDDDELVNQKTEEIASGNTEPYGEIQMKTYPEISSVPRSENFNDFCILINLKAPVMKAHIDSRAPIDLVTVLDISGSMTGTKIALLKQAMGFVIQNLGPLDRLSVIAFSSSARRLFCLRHMTESGKQESLQMINSLVANGGTNIAEALKKGAKVMTDRRYKNPVSSMVLLSDGQDTYSCMSSISPRKPGLKPDYQTLLPDCNCNVPIHTFGFGVDHDSSAMHSISEHSGGMFSFIEAENVIQDAFAQCIGGLLSVVVQELRVEVECGHPVLHLKSIKAGSYKVGIDSNRRSGFIEVGDLYAEEERDFLVTMDIPVSRSEIETEMQLVKFKILHKDPITKALVTVGGDEAVVISRPETTAAKQVVSIEVDRQRNRLTAANAIAEARVFAEQGDLTNAMSLLDNCRTTLSESPSARAGDRLCVGLVAELREMKERMASRRVYESSGRAYVLSGLSSHSWQRATARGDSTEVTSQIQTYQTPSMVDMVNLSQTMCFSRSPSSSMANPVAVPAKKSLRSIRSFPAMQPR